MQGSVFDLNVIFMYVPEELKVNKFVAARIPSVATYFQRLGSFTPASHYFTGDETPRDLNKVDALNDYQRYAEMKAAEAAQHSEE